MRGACGFNQMENRPLHIVDQTFHFMLHTYVDVLCLSFTHTDLFHLDGVVSTVKSGSASQTCPWSLDCSREDGGTHGGQLAKEPPSEPLNGWQTLHHWGKHTMPVNIERTCLCFFTNSGRTDLELARSWIPGLSGIC